MKITKKLYKNVSLNINMISLIWKDFFYLIINNILFFINNALISNDK